LGFLAHGVHADTRKGHRRVGRDRADHGFRYWERK
jgi:hypothetical protein